MSDNNKTPLTDHLKELKAKVDALKEDLEDWNKRLDANLAKAKRLVDEIVALKEFEP